MRVLDLMTTAGGSRPNEDRAGHCGTLAWVIDGATDLYHDAALPADRDVTWLVDYVCGRLAELGAEGYRGPAARLLADVADQVAARQRASGFPSGRLPPACSLAVVVDLGRSFEVARVGDATAVVTGDQSMLLVTDFFERRERAAVAVQHSQTDAQVRAALLRRREHTMTAGDVESVFSGHPSRRLRPHVRAGTWQGVEHLLLCTDGFARLVTDYAVYGDWPAAVAAARVDGLAGLEKLLRECERGPTGTAAGRFKRADDAAALLLAPDPAASTVPQLGGIREV